MMAMKERRNAQTDGGMPQKEKLRNAKKYKLGLEPPRSFANHPQRTANEGRNSLH